MKRFRYSLRTLLLMFVLVPVLFLLGRLFLLALGDWGRGRVDRACDIPYVGRVIRTLDAEGPIAYRYSHHPHGSSTCTISGVASRSAVETLCDDVGATLSLEGTDNIDRKWILRLVDDAFADSREFHGWNAFELNRETLVIFGMGGKVQEIYGVFNPETERFAIFVFVP